MRLKLLVVLASIIFHHVANVSASPWFYIYGDDAVWTWINGVSTTMKRNGDTSGTQYSMLPSCCHWAYSSSDVKPSLVNYAVTYAFMVQNTGGPGTFVGSFNYFSTNVLTSSSSWRCKQFSSLSSAQTYTSNNPNWNTASYYDSDFTTCSTNGQYTSMTTPDGRTTNGIWCSTSSSDTYTCLFRYVDYAKPPSVPLSVSASWYGVTQSTVSFSVPSNSDLPISLYTVYQNGVATSFNSSYAGSITVTGLVRDVGYRFTIVATNAVGSSAESSPAYAYTGNPWFWVWGDDIMWTWINGVSTNLIRKDDSTFTLLNPAPVCCYWAFPASTTKPNTVNNAVTYAFMVQNTGVEGYLAGSFNYHSVNTLTSTAWKCKLFTTLSAAQTYTSNNPTWTTASFNDADFSPCSLSTVKGSLTSPDGQQPKTIWCSTSNSDTYTCLIRYVDYGSSVPSISSVVAGNVFAWVYYSDTAKRSNSLYRVYIDGSASTFTSTSSSGSIKVTGLTSGRTYSFTVFGTNDVGSSTSVAVTKKTGPIWFYVYHDDINTLWVNGVRQKFVSNDDTSYTLSDPAPLCCFWSYNAEATKPSPDNNAAVYAGKIVNTGVDGYIQGVFNYWSSHTTATSTSWKCKIFTNQGLADSWIASNPTWTSKSYDHSSWSNCYDNKGSRMAPNGQTAFSIWGQASKDTYTTLYRYVDLAQAPSAPLSIYATSYEVGQSTITFSAPSVTDLPITLYTVYKNGQPTSFTRTSPGSVTVTGLESGTGYYFTVVATSVAGNSAQSSSYYITTAGTSSSSSLSSTTSGASSGGSGSSSTLTVGAVVAVIITIVIVVIICVYLVRKKKLKLPCFKKEVTSSAHNSITSTYVQNSQVPNTHALPTNNIMCQQSPQVSLPVAHPIPTHDMIYQQPQSNMQTSVEMQYYSKQVPDVPSYDDVVPSMPPAYDVAWQRPGESSQ